MLEFNWACSVLLLAWLDSQALSPVSVTPPTPYSSRPVSALPLQLFDLLVYPNPESFYQACHTADTQSLLTDGIYGPRGHRSPDWFWEETDKPPMVLSSP